MSCGMVLMVYADVQAVLMSCVSCFIVLLTAVVVRAVPVLICPGAWFCRGTI